MPVLDYFRNFFGGSSPPAPNNEKNCDNHGDRFRNPIWQIGEDDDDEVDDFRQPGDRMHFSIFTDPIEISRYFESQMDSMLKHFFQGFGGNDNFFSLPDSPPVNALPPPKSKSLRDTFLKEDDSGFEHSDTKVDTDLDGKIIPDDFTNVWKNNQATKGVQTFSRPQVFSNSVQKQIFRTPDGFVEHRQTIRDSQGNEETIVSRQIGDKTYTVTTKRDKDGVETKTEDLINMDESDLKLFEEKWTPMDNARQSSILNSFPWEKLFGP